MTLPDRLREPGPLLVAKRTPQRGAFHCAGATHPGLVRDHNEDRVHVDAEHGTLIVVDGIGGQSAGETAATIAIAFLRSRLERQTGRAEDRVREAIAVANNEIVRRAAQDPALAGMGCVLTLAVIEDGMVTVGHVGDSRLYRLGADGIVKVTRDHSPVGMREDEGELSEADAMRHPRRNEVYRSLGAEEHTPFDEDFVEVSRFPFDPEGAILLCSDGLTDLVSSQTIARIFRGNAGDEQATAERLIDAANAAGGKDNVTVALAVGERFAAALAAPVEGGIERAAEPRAESAWPDEMPPERTREWPSFAFAVIVAALVLFAAVLLVDRARLRASPEPALETSRAARVLLVGPGAQYGTIGDALADARSGDTVSVAPGVYREQVRLEQGVALVSRVPREAVLAPRSDGASPLVAIVAEGISAGSIVGMRIAPGHGEPLDIGIRVSDARIAIEDVEVTGARVAGVAFQGQSDATLLGSLIHANAGAGVTVASPAAPRLAHNLILDNGRGGHARAGVELERGAAPTFVGNVIVGNGAEGIRGAPAALRDAILQANIFMALGRPNQAGALGPRR
jgi:serine/threonine protein phosphatase PrpC